MEDGLCNGNGAPAQVLRGPPCVALFPSPGFGHLSPIVEFAKLLISRHGFSVTIVTLAASSTKAQAALLSTLPPAISSFALPAVPLDDLPSDAYVETIMSVAVLRSLPDLRRALSQLRSSANLVAFVADLFSPDSLAVARELSLPAYLFFPTNLLALSLFFHLPELDAAITCEYRDLPEPLRLPGCVPIPGPELLHPIQDRSNDAYRWIVSHGQRFREADGVIVNSFDALEPEAAKLLRQTEPGRPPVYLVGPLTTESNEDAECLRWLDKHPPESVLFVSFGSAGTLSTAQMAELALGLEMSGQRFLWVVRSPTDSGDVSEAYFTAQSKRDPFNFLPSGFLDRTREVGLLVPSWAPQAAVLNHAATGGFLSHCGWNSTLETVKAGVPVVAWPLFAEQRQNAVMLVEGARIALRVQAEAGGLVRREEVARAARELMEGEQGKGARRRVSELREAAMRGLDKGGAAYEALAEVANKWKEHALTC